MSSRRWGGLVHEFMSLDGVIDAPTWTFEYGFDERMGERLTAVTNRCQGILLGRRTYEMFEPAWSTRTMEDDPGVPVLQRHHQVRRLRDARKRDLEELGDRRAPGRGSSPKRPTPERCRAPSPTRTTTGCST